MEVSKVINLILSTITTCTVIFTFYQLKVNQKQLHLSTITKCIIDFRNLGILTKETNDPVVLNHYIDLTNEELFYFQHKYIPEEVSKEWIDGMISFMPMTNRKHEILNADYCVTHLALQRNEYLKGFPRVQNAFEISGEYDFDLIYSRDEDQRLKSTGERKKLIKEILKNIHRFDWFD